MDQCQTLHLRAREYKTAEKLSAVLMNRAPMLFGFIDPLYLLCVPESGF